jgi:hypothetical protein
MASVPPFIEYTHYSNSYLPKSESKSRPELDKWGLVPTNGGEAGSRSLYHTTRTTTNEKKERTDEQDEMNSERRVFFFGNA